MRWGIAHDLCTRCSARQLPDNYGSFLAGSSWQQGEAHAAHEAVPRVSQRESEPDQRHAEQPAGPARSEAWNSPAADAWQPRDSAAPAGHEQLGQPPYQQQLQQQLLHVQPGVPPGLPSCSDSLPHLVEPGYHLPADLDGMSPPRQASRLAALAPTQQARRNSCSRAVPELQRSSPGSALVDHPQTLPRLSAGFDSPCALQQTRLEQQQQHTGALNPPWPELLLIQAVSQPQPQPQQPRQGPAASGQQRAPPGFCPALPSRPQPCVPPGPSLGVPPPGTGMPLPGLGPGVLPLLPPRTAPQQPGNWGSSVPLQQAPAQASPVLQLAPGLAHLLPPVRAQGVAVPLPKYDPILALPPMAGQPLRPAAGVPSPGTVLVDAGSHSQLLVPAPTLLQATGASWRHVSRRTCGCTLSPAY